MPVNLNSPVWNEQQRTDIASRTVTRIAKRFKADTKDKMVAGPHTGLLYLSRNTGHAAGFKRYHRASARGERPSPDTFNLVNNVKDEKDGPLSHRVYVDEGAAPYAKYLQDPDILDRPIATLEDAEGFIQTTQIKAELVKAKHELTGVYEGGTL